MATVMVMVVAVVNILSKSLCFIKDNLVLISLLALAGIAHSETSENTISSTLLIGTGYLEHPRRVSIEPAASYLYQSFSLTNISGTKEQYYRFGYNVNTSQFGNNTSLGFWKHGLAFEFFNKNSKKKQNLSLGVQISSKHYENYYSIYNNKDVYSYVALKKNYGNQAILKGYAALRYKKFTTLPEEDFLEPHGQIKLQYFTKKQTTLELALNLGSKFYTSPIAPLIWDTRGTPTVSRFSTRIKIAKKLSSRLALRGWYESNKKLSDFPHYVADNIYDSPLLDSYAYDGHDTFLAIKLLAPKQTWVEFFGSYGSHDYGSLLFPVEASAELRKDHVTLFGFSTNRYLSSLLKKPQLKINMGWSDQDSSLPEYSYSGIYLSSSLSWNW
jgi:hypothetical protein